MESWTQVVYNVSATNLRKIRLQNTGGYIREAKNQTYPTVVLHASNPALLHALVVKEMNSVFGDAIELSFQSDTAITSDYILEILVPSKSIQSVDIGDGGNTVIFPNALTNEVSKDIFLTANGNSTLFVESTTIEANRFLAESLGRGYVQINTDSIQADLIDLASAGSGDVALITGTAKAKKFITLAAGSGNIVVESYNGTPVKTIDLVSKSVAGGDIIFSTGGTCNSSYVESSGAGSSYLSKMACQDTAAVLYSVGDIYVSAASSFASNDTGAGNVYAILDPTTIATGDYTPLTNVTIPSYSSLIVPDNAPFTISLEGTGTPMPTTQPSTQASLTSMPAMKEIQSGHSSLRPGCLAGVIFGTVIAMFAIVIVVIRRRQLKRARQATKFECIANVDYSEATTPIGSPTLPQVLTK